MKNILITGGAGYLGSVLSRLLIRLGCNVRVIDNLMFENDSIIPLLEAPNFEFIKGDVRNIGDVNSAIQKMDVVVHLAGIVGDPACEIKKQLAVETNYLATPMIVKICKENNIKRFIFASTCSVYGASEKEELTEKSKLNPVSLYANTKMKSENEIRDYLKDSISSTILRFGTLYGLSPRMRFDLVVNFLTQKAFREKDIMIMGGQQWRPFLHVKDAASSIIKVIDAPLNKIENEIFNVGSNSENYKLEQIGALIKKHLPATQVKHVVDSNDKRSYNVSFDKIKKVLGFKTEKTVEQGIVEIKEALSRGLFKNPLDKKYHDAAL